MDRLTSMLPSAGVLGYVGYVALAAVLVLFVYGLHPIKRWQYRQIPGPSPTWLIGNLGSIVAMGFPFYMEKLAAQYGPVFKVWQGGNVLIVCEHPVAARSVNMRNNERPPGFFTFFSGEEKRFDDASMLIAGGKLWQSLRQAWQVLFHPQNLRAYTTVMNASAERLVNVLGKKAKSGEQAEMWRLFGCHVMEVICSTALGMDVQALQGDTKAISAEADAVHFEDTDDDCAQLQKSAAILFGFAGASMSPYIGLKLLFPELGTLLGYLALWLPDRSMAKFIQARHVMNNLCYRLIERTKQQMQALGTDGGSGTAGKRTSRLTVTPAVTNGGSHAEEDLGKLLTRPDGLPDSIFIAKLLEADNKLLDGGRSFTNMEVASQLNTFLLAGYETTASSLAFTVYHVAKSPEAEAKLLAEIDAFGRSRAPTLEELDQLPYLDAVFRETLRLCPPASLGTLRLAKEDQDVCGYTIRKGWHISTCMYSYHRNPQYWKDPEEFQPDRFLTVKDAGELPFAPFGDGGRSCVGMRLAQAEAKIALTRLYQHFTFRLLPGQDVLEITKGVSFSPKNGVKVTVHPRS
jgi:thromboxane-A synthase/cytochrome P450 family 3 subfamily A